LLKTHRPDPQHLSERKRTAIANPAILNVGLD
jgi:hypothetical protein